MGWDKAIDEKYLSLVETAARGNKKAREELGNGPYLRSMIKGWLKRSLPLELYYYEWTKNDRESESSLIQEEVIKIIVDKNRKAQQLQKKNPFLEKSVIPPVKNSDAYGFYLNVLSNIRDTKKWKIHPAPERYEEDYPSLRKKEFWELPVDEQVKRLWRDGVIRNLSVLHKEWLTFYGPRLDDDNPQTFFPAFRVIAGNVIKNHVKKIKREHYQNSKMTEYRDQLGEQTEQMPEHEE